MLRWFHWAIILCSLLLTFFAWHYSKSEKEARVKVQFNREVERVIELVQERMGKYEDALWAGVSLINSSPEEVDFERWRQYARSLQINDKYFGINGIGVIHCVQEDQMERYLEKQRRLRPDFRVYPQHKNELKLPISYIVPVTGNEKAVGLDVAHENNRYTAAIKARDSGKSQITGPITLVQDHGKTPGFLFYAPFYDDKNSGENDDKNDGENNGKNNGVKNRDFADPSYPVFAGMVYAPFVVKKLMKGTLEKRKRQVGIEINDGDQQLYNEHIAADPDYDPAPLFKSQIELDFYGRTWEFNIWSTHTFRTATTDRQPLTILIGGLIIDGLLVFLFLTISRASNRALQLADSMTDQLQQKSKTLRTYSEELKQSNKDLEQFAFIASHDLQEPLRKVASFGVLLNQQYADKLDFQGKRYLDFMVDGATRMKVLIEDLLEFSKIGVDQNQLTTIDANIAFGQAVFNLSHAIADANAEITKDDLPNILAKESEMIQLFQNLIGNAIKYRADLPPKIHVWAMIDQEAWRFSVTDNGIGIDQPYHEQIFGVFKRLHHQNEFSGTGIGLAICKRIVDGLNGRIWVESKIDAGCTIHFTVPLQPAPDQ